MVLTQPYDNRPAKNALTVSRGQHAFLQFWVTQGGVLTTPDADMFDAADVVKIERRVGGVVQEDVTSDFATITLDSDPLPDGKADTYDDNHADYVSTGSSPVGIFQSQANLAKIALKIQPPVTAVITNNDIDQDYLVTWKPKKNGDTTTVSEIFNVSEAVTGSFSPPSPTVDDVRDEVVTSLTDSEIQSILSRQTSRVLGKLDQCGVTLSDENVIPEPIYSAIATIAAQKVIMRDAGAGAIVSKRKEGRKEVVYSISAQRWSDSIAKEAWEDIEEYCNLNGTSNKPRFSVTRQGINKGLWDPHRTRRP